MNRRARMGWGGGLLSGALLGVLGLVSAATAGFSLAGPPEARWLANGPRSSDVAEAADAGGAVADSSVPPVVLLYFTQAQCPPCRQMQPMIEHLAARGFPIQKVEVDAHPGVAQQFQVQSTPTFVLLQNGQELKRHSGILTSYQINSLLIDAGFPADQDVLNKPTSLSPIINFLDRLRPAARSAPRGKTVAAGPKIAQPTATIPSHALTPVEQLALQATARIKVEYPERGQTVTDYGTATVIHRHEADILLLTCGHVFRDSQGRGTIRVELDFSDGQPKEVVLGQLLRYDAGAPDVAILTARTRLPIRPMALAAEDFQPEPNAITFSVGCDHGQPAAVRRGNYLATLRCGAVQQGNEPDDGVMARKFGVSGRPVVGRSGGGLFSADGQLIGVCNAAVVESDEGRYSAIDNVFDLLAATNLRTLFSKNSGVEAVAATPANGQSPPPSYLPPSPAASSRMVRSKFLPVIEAERMATAMTIPHPTGPPTAIGNPATVRPHQMLGQSPR